MSKNSDEQQFDLFVPFVTDLPMGTGSSPRKDEVSPRQPTPIRRAFLRAASTGRVCFFAIETVPSCEAGF